MLTEVCMYALARLLTKQVSQCLLHYDTDVYVAYCRRMKVGSWLNRQWREEALE